MGAVATFSGSHTPALIAAAGDRAAYEQHPGMAGWREELFVLMQRNAEETAAYFCIPAKQAMEVGTDIKI